MWIPWQVVLTCQCLIHDLDWESPWLWNHLSLLQKWIQPTNQLTWSQSWMEWCFPRHVPPQNLCHWGPVRCQPQGSPIPRGYWSLWRLGASYVAQRSGESYVAQRSWSASDRSDGCCIDWGSLERISHMLHSPECRPTGCNRFLYGNGRKSRVLHAGNCIYCYDMYVHFNVLTMKRCLFQSIYTERCIWLLMFYIK